MHGLKSYTAQAQRLGDTALLYGIGSCFLSAVLCASTLYLGLHRVPNWKQEYTSVRGLSYGIGFRDTSCLGVAARCAGRTPWTRPWELCSQCARGAFVACRSGRSASFLPTICQQSGNRGGPRTMPTMMDGHWLMLSRTQARNRRKRRARHVDPRQVL